MGRAGLVLVAVTLLACGKKDNPHKKMRLVQDLQVELVDGRVRVSFEVVDGYGEPAIADGVAELVVIQYFDTGNKEVCHGRWEVHDTEAVPRVELFDPTCTKPDHGGNGLHAELTFTSTVEGMARTTSYQYPQIDEDYEKNHRVGGVSIDAGTPLADATAYLALLTEIAAATAEQREGTTSCEGALSAALDPTANPMSWIVEHDQIGVLVTGVAKPEYDAFAWINTPFSSVESVQRALPKRPPVLLVVTPRARAMPVYVEAAQGNRKGKFDGGSYEGTLYAVDHETGAVACHIPLSVRSSEQVEGRDEVEADFKRNFFEAVRRARGRLSSPLWQDEEPPPEY